MYTYENGKYQFHNQSGEVFEYDAVALAYDKDGYVFLKHGSPDRVAKWSTNMRDKYVAAGYQAMLKNISVIIINDNEKIPVEEINKIIDVAGYIKYFLEKYDNGN